MAWRNPVHQPVGVQTWAERQAEYASQRKSRSHLYGHRWRKLRAAFLATHPLCACGCGWPATVVDHRVPHNGDHGLLFAWDNLEAMTKPCHDRKTAARDGGFGNPIKVAS